MIRGAHGPGEPRIDSGPICFGMGLDIEYNLGPFNIWAALLLSDRKPKAWPGMAQKRSTCNL